MNRYFLTTDRFGEYVAQYTPDEVEAEFTPEQRAALDKGETITKGRSTWTDMLIATRAHQNRSPATRAKVLAARGERSNVAAVR